MKLAFFTFYLFSSFIALGQTEPIKLPEKEGKINFEEIIMVDTVNKEQLYKDIQHKSAPIAIGANEAK